MVRVNREGWARHAACQPSGKHRASQPRILTQTNQLQEHTRAAVQTISSPGEWTWPSLPILCLHVGKGLKALQLRCDPRIQHFPEAAILRRSRVSDQAGGLHPHTPQGSASAALAPPWPTSPAHNPEPCPHPSQVHTQPCPHFQSRPYTCVATPTHP